VGSQTPEKPEQEHEEVEDPTSGIAKLIAAIFKGGGRGLWTFGIADFSLSCLTCQQSIQKGLGAWFSLLAFLGVVAASTWLIFVLIVADTVHRRATASDNKLIAFLERQIVDWLRKLFRD